MKINSFSIDPIDVDEERQIGTPFVRVSSPCPCGCSPYPYISISDGKQGISVCFETMEELVELKRLVNNLHLSPTIDEIAERSLPELLYEKAIQELGKWKSIRESQDIEGVNANFV